MDVHGKLLLAKILLLLWILRYSKSAFVSMTLFFKLSSMMYLYYGSLGVLLWKCGSQLLKEAKYKNFKVAMKTTIYKLLYKNNEKKKNLDDQYKKNSPLMAEKKVT